MSTTASIAIEQLVKQIPAVKEFISVLNNGQSVHVSRAMRPARPLLASLIGQQCHTNILWITPTSDGAERLCQDLAFFLPPSVEPWFFPEKENAAMLGEAGSSGNPMRLAVLQALEKQQTNKMVIAAPIKAILQPTVKAERLEHGKLTLSVGESVDLELLLELLTAEGYQRVPMVERRGEFSVRGCIIDAYPITGKPKRLELFGDEIDSIRVLNIDTQRSSEEAPDVVLLPASESDEESAWLTDYLSRFAPNTIVCLEESAQLRLTAQEWYQEWNQDCQSDMWPEVTKMLQNFRVCDLTAWADSTTASSSGSQNYELPLQLASGFTGRVEEMLGVLPQWQAKGFYTVILSRQYKRLKELFSERQIINVVTEAQNLLPGQIMLLNGNVDEGFSAELGSGHLEFLTDHEIVGLRRQRTAVREVNRGSSLRLDELNIGDYVVHLQHGIGRYLGVKTLALQGVERDLLHLEYAKGDAVYVPVEQLDLVQKYQGVDDVAPSLSKMGGQEWNRTKAKIRENTKQLAEALLKIYAERSQVPGYAFPPDTPWQHEMEDSFPYNETPDQLRAINEVKADMERPHPMDRLVCGDVGYGKTEVALRAAFKAAVEGRQTLVLAPTTVLAHQHYQTFSERLASFPVSIRLLSRDVTDKEQTSIVEGLKAGKIDIAIGTHRLLSKDVEVKNLGLLIIDEEHRFGVMHKEKLKEMRAAVDVLCMSATPIPRTLQMSFYGIRELSLIQTPPEQRLPIKTYLFEHNPDLIKAAITRELSRQGQVFFVHNRVQGIERVAADIRRLIPQARVAVGHGQMAEHQLEKVMMDFYEERFDVLVCTTIIESGLDIPNTNTTIINNAQAFGLAQLYQLRGRVGRSVKQAYCYLLYPPTRKLTAIAEKRLDTIRDFAHLGAGFQIAQRDLEIRGAGNMLGAEQSGHVAAIGFDLYCRMLNEAVKELQGQTTVVPCEQTIAMQIPVSASLPDQYVSDARQKVALYKRLAASKTNQDVQALREELRDRYGPLPQATENLLQLVLIKLLAMELLMPSICIKDGTMAMMLPFSKELTAKNRFKIKQQTGWDCAYEQMSLVFTGLFGRAAGRKQYPPDEELLTKILDTMKLLKNWLMTENATSAADSSAKTKKSVRIGGFGG